MFQEREKNYSFHALNHSFDHNKRESKLQVFRSCKPNSSTRDRIKCEAINDSVRSFNLGVSLRVGHAGDIIFARFHRIYRDGKRFDSHLQSLPTRIW